MGQLVSKSMSLGQILEKPCVHSRGHIFSPIILKVGQNVGFDQILNLGHLRSKIGSLGQMLEKTLFTL